MSANVDADEEPDHGRHVDADVYNDDHFDFGAYGPRVERRVDAVDGEVHRAFDGLPNSVYLVGTDGMVGYRADWVDPDDLARRIDHLLAAGGRGADVEPVGVVEKYRQPSPSMLAKGPRVFPRVGRGSLRDFTRSLPSMLRHRLSG